MADETIRIDTRIDTDSAERDLDELKKKLKDTSAEGKKGFNEAGKALDTADKSTKGLTVSMNTLKKALTGLSISAVAYKVAQGVKEIYTTTEEAYESIRKASTMFGDVAVDQQNLVNQLSKIAAETGSEISTLGEAVYQAMSAGIAPTEDMADVLSAVEKSAKLASGGFTDTETAMSATLSVLNAYKMDIKDLDKIQGILLQTQNKGVTTVGQLGSALSKVTPTASAFGVSFEQVASAIALMTKQGTNTEVATTALSTILSELGKSGTTASENLEKASKASGKTATSFKELLNEGMNVSEILSMMGDYAKQNGLSLVDMFGSVEAGRAALQLAGENTSDFNDILASMGDTAGLVSEAFEKTVTPADKLSSAFNNLVVSVGTKMKPAWDGLATALSTVLEKMTGQSDYAPTYESTLNSLARASENLKKAQKEAGEEITATTLAMQFQSKVDFWTGIGKASDEYDKLNKSLTILEKQQIKQQRLVDLNMNTLSSAASDAGLSIDELISQLALLKNGYIDVIEGVDYYKLTSLVAAAEVVGNNKAAVDSIGKQIEDTQSAIDGFVSSLAEMVNKGVISISEISLVNSSLAAEVRTVVTQLQKEAKAVKDLKGAAKELNAESDSIDPPVDPSSIDALEDLQEEIESTRNKYEILSLASDVLGDSFYTQKDYLEDLKELYAKGLVEGLDASSDAMENLRAEINKTQEAIEDVDDASIDWEKTMKEFAKSSYQTALKSTSALFGELLQQESRLDEMTTKLTDLYDEESEKITDLEDAQYEYQVAVDHGSEQEIRNAKKKVDSTQEALQATRDLITATKNEKKSIEDGSEAWKILGNSAMQSLGAILQALGSELAAKAAISLFDSPWLAVGLGAASLAAFGAAEWIKSQKFAQGGIVGGTSYSGDNVLARVNSGELILNMSQQDNIAKALSTLAEMSGLGGGAGAGINIYLSGASFYGLDEPAVGKAIYDNIRQLRYEGVI